MYFTKLSLKKPMASAIIIVAVLVFGLFSYFQMPVDLLPGMNFPTITIITVYPGATPEQVDSMVSSVIETAVSSVNGIKDIEATSYNSASVVICEFDYNVDLKDTKVKLNEKLDSIAADLPSQAEKPVVSIVDVQGTPLVTVSISGETSMQELTNFTNSYVLPPIEQITDVAKVELKGDQKKEISVYLNPQQLDSAGLSQNDVVMGLQMMNASIPLGQTNYDEKNISITGNNVIETLDMLKTVPIKSLFGEGTALLSEFSKIEVTEVENKSLSTLNSNPNITMYVYKKTGGNALKIAEKVQAELDYLNTNNLGISATIIDNQANFISMSLGNVWQSLVIGGFLAIIVLILFLKSFKTAMAIGISIPISVIATMGLMNSIGIQLNIISLGGLAIGVGMVVDNAIVVLESIYKCREEGEPIEQAALSGTSQVVGAVFASTLTTIAVFLPVGLTTGFTKEIFAQLSITITFALSASFIVSMTALPVMSVKLVDAQEDNQGIKGILNKFFKKMESDYTHILEYTLLHKGLVIFMATLVFAGSVAMIPLIGTEFLPPMDQGVVKLSFNTESGISMSQVQDRVYEVETELYKMPEIEMVQTTMGARQDGSWGADMTCKLVARDYRDGVNEVAQAVRENLQNLTHLNIKVTAVNDLMNAMFGDLGNFGAPVSVGITADSIEDLNYTSELVKQVVDHVDGTINITSTQDNLSNDIKVKVDNRKAAALGLNPLMVSNQVRTAIEGTVPVTVKLEGQDLDVRVRFDPKYVDTISKIKQMQIKAYTSFLTMDNNTDVALSSIASFDISDTPSVVHKKDGKYYGEVSASVVGVAAGKTNATISEHLKTLDLPTGVEFNFGGQQSLLEESFTGLMNALLVSVAIVYIVMAIQFNSFKNPFIIMMSLPLAFTGSLIGLLLVRVTLNVVSFIGLIMLVGVVVNNAIVLIDRITFMREKGYTINESILDAGKSRMRPILMTALTTILGLLPLVLISGDGSELMKPMAVVVVGGMVTSTALSLVVIPAIYGIFNKDKTIK